MQYFLLTLKHKWYVFLAGLKTGAPLYNLIVHDWTKFTWAELPHYQRQFFGDKGNPDGFAAAWLHHQNHNPHHWEFWLPRTGHSKGFVMDEAVVCAHQPETGPYDIVRSGRVLATTGTWKAPVTNDEIQQWWDDSEEIKDALNMRRALPMPEKYVREMAADLMGAGKAYTGSWDISEWLEKNASKMVLHPDTTIRLCAVFGRLGVSIPKCWHWAWKGRSF